MSPENPIVLTVDEDGRLQLARGLIPQWLRSDTRSYLVPLHWKRDVRIPQGHELEAWIAWNTGSNMFPWVLDPRTVLDADATDPREQSLRSLMFDMRIDTKDRLCCPGLLASLVKIAGRFIWVGPESGSISVWSNFAFQAAHGPHRDA